MSMSESILLMTSMYRCWSTLMKVLWNNWLVTQRFSLMKLVLKQPRASRLTQLGCSVRSYTQHRCQNLTKYHFRWVHCDILQLQLSKPIQLPTNTFQLSEKKLLSYRQPDKALYNKLTYCLAQSTPPVPKYLRNSILLWNPNVHNHYKSPLWDTALKYNTFSPDPLSSH